MCISDDSSDTLKYTVSKWIPGEGQYNNIIAIFL